MPPSPSSPPANKLLARLPVDEYRRLLPDLETISLRSGRLLLKPHAPTQKVYFLRGGVCSITMVTAEGEMAGVAIVGNEGLIGLAAWGDAPESGETATVKIAEGDAQALDVNVFRREMEHWTAFTDLIHRYAQAFIESLMQSVACNALHSVEQRCARCLLEIRDRIGRNDLPLTQDVLAHALGVRRPSVTLATAALHRARLIEHSRKRIVIRDPSRLETSACECYGVIRAHFARLFRD